MGKFISKKRKEKIRNASEFELINMILNENNSNDIRDIPWVVSRDIDGGVTLLKYASDEDKS